MATIRCPQCGTEIEEGSTEFCPNPTCGFPLSFSKEPEVEADGPAMERRPMDPAPTVQAQPQPPAPPPPVVTAPVTAAAAAPKKGMNPAALIAGALVLVAAIAAVAIFVLGGGDEKKKPVAQPSSKGAAVLSFSRVNPDESVFGGDADQVINRVAAGDDGLMAVGHDGAIGSYDAAAWTSQDGETWNRVTPDPEVFGGDGEQEMLGVAKGPDGYVITGYDSSTGDKNAAVWTSDGVVFDRVDPTQSALGGPGDQVMTRVIAGGPGFIAVGIDGATGEPNAGVWISKDGTRWARANSASSLGGEGAQFMRSIAEYENGFVGVGREMTSEGVDAAVWKSTGTAFDRILGTQETFGGPGQQQMYTVTTGGPGLVAVGSAGSGGNVDGAVWTSADGETWDRAPNDQSVFGADGTQEMYGVDATSDLVVAVGYDAGADDSDSGPGVDAAVWESTDGSTWTRVPSESFGGADTQQMRGVLIFDDKVIAVGWSGPTGDYDGAIWSAPIKFEG